MNVKNVEKRLMVKVFVGSSKIGNYVVYVVFLVLELFLFGNFGIKYMFCISVVNVCFF